jgi:hypothetical protein
VTSAELEQARLHPRKIVHEYLYADVGVIVAPGGTGKTTLLLYEAIHLALGRPLWGLEINHPGRTLFVTAEDQRERFVARLRMLMEGLALSEEERATCLQSIAIWDVTGHELRLVAVAESRMIMVTTLADRIVDAYRSDDLAQVVFDPLVHFGAAESLVNDNEQGLIRAARRIVRGLDCCVRLVHHTGKANARESTNDQYSGRGGSALADGARMVAVLQAWTPDSKLTPPSSALPATNLLVLNRAKLSYAAPNLAPIWVKRTDWTYQHFMPAPTIDPAQRIEDAATQVKTFLSSQLQDGRRYTQNMLEDVAKDQLGMVRARLRSALATLKASGQVVERDLPDSDRQGRKNKYLHPIM